MEDWAEKYLTGKFKNNLGSTCELVAKNGKINGKYFTKPSRGELTQPGFDVSGIYVPVKDGALLTIIVTFKIKGEKENGLEKFSQCCWNGKVYANEKLFKMNWLLLCNESKENEWAATNMGQDQFEKI